MNGSHNGSTSKTVRLRPIPTGDDQVPPSKKAKVDDAHKSNGVTTSSDLAPVVSSASPPASLLWVDKYKPKSSKQVSAEDPESSIHHFVF